MKQANHHSPTYKMLPPTLFTVPEAAWLAETRAKVVEGEFDKKVVTTRCHGKRMLDRWDVSYLRITRNLHQSWNVDFRRRVYEAVRKAQISNQASVEIEALIFQVGSILSEIDQRLVNLREARELVQRSHAVMGGEEVIRGTRIPVRMLAEMHRKGASRKELAKSYDLCDRYVELAILYDDLHPRRGRPALAQADQWINLGENERFDVEDLGAYRAS